MYNKKICLILALVLLCTTLFPTMMPILSFADNAEDIVEILETEGGEKTTNPVEYPNLEYEDINEDILMDDDIDIVGENHNDTKENLALNKPAEASSSRNTTNRSPMKANDGDEETMWLAGNNKFPQWWMVDLEDVYSINQTDLVFEFEGETKYTIDVSTDKENWTRVVDKSDNSTLSQKFTDEIDPIDGRYMRVNIYAMDVPKRPGAWAAICEFKVFGEPKEKVDKTELVSKVEFAESLVEEDYTPETWTRLIEAIDQAYEIILNPNASQKDVLQSLADLNKAIEELQAVEGLIKVTGVELDRNSLSMEVGSTKQLKAKVIPTNASNKNVSWLSSNNDIVTVDKKGLVKAKAVGDAKIIVTTEDGSKTAICEVTVKRKSSGKDRPDDGNLGTRPIYPNKPVEDKQTSKPTSTPTSTPKSDPEKPKTNFEDLDKYPWAKNEIEYLASKGIIKGTSDTSFSPEKNITRADFILLLVRALDFDSEFDDNFADVYESDYFYEALGVAKKLGIAKGIGNNKFNPTDEISRQDMMVLIARALEVKKGFTISGTVADLSDFIDADKVSIYAIESVATLVKEGIVQGSNKMLNPLKHTTRAETAVMIYRIYEIVEAL